jgi:transcriptional regulator with XRE-family HTH domain
MASIVERVGDIGAYLREQREGARLSVRQLASLAGVSNPYLSQIERGLRYPSAEVLGQLAKGLRISAEALYIRAGILDPVDRPEVEAAIAADPHLLDRQRRVLLDIYTSFRTENRRADDERADAGNRPDAAVPPAPARPRRAAVKRTARAVAAPQAATQPRARKAAAKASARKATTRRTPTTSADAEPGNR